MFSDPCHRCAHVTEEASQITSFQSSVTSLRSTIQCIVDRRGVYTPVTWVTEHVTILHYDAGDACEKLHI